MCNSMIFNQQNAGPSLNLAWPSLIKASALTRRRHLQWLIKSALWILTMMLPLISGGQQPLGAYLTAASESNPGLQAQYAAFEASLERAAQVSGLPNPSLSFGYFIQPVETRVGPQQARFSLSQMFPWFGSLSARGDAVAAMAQADYLQFIDAREKLNREVKTQYYRLWQIQEFISLDQQNLMVLQSYEKLATTRFRSGEGKLSGVYRVQLEIEESKTKLRILEKQLLQLQRNFNRLLNREATLAVELPDTLIVPDILLAVDSAGLHPSVARFQQMGESAAFRESAARKSAWPSLGLGLDYVIVGERSDIQVTDNGKDVIMPMASISLPLWQKQYGAARREAELQQEQYQWEAQNAINNLQSQYDLARFQLRQAQDELELYKEEIALARKTLELTITDYSNGREEFEEILRLQQKIIHYQKQQIKSLVNILNNNAQLTYLDYRIQ